MKIKAFDKSKTLKYNDNDRTIKIIMKKMKILAEKA